LSVYNEARRAFGQHPISKPVFGPNNYDKQLFSELGIKAPTVKPDNLNLAQPNMNPPIPDVRMPTYNKRNQGLPVAPDFIKELSPATRTAKPVDFAPLTQFGKVFDNLTIELRNDKWDGLTKALSLFPTVVKHNHAGTFDVQLTGESALGKEIAGRIVDVIKEQVRIGKADLIKQIEKGDLI
jgi:hypothetical protein